MKTKAFIIIFYSVIIAVIKPAAQECSIKRITDHILLVSIPGKGEDLLIISSAKGLVPINTFWSTITSDQYKSAIVKELNRKDFIYTLNTVDRLDMFGGNKSFSETAIIGHREFINKYKGKEAEVEKEIRKLIEMWRFKEDASRKRLENYKEGSEQAKNEARWTNTCKQRAEELEQGFSLVLPEITYTDRMSLDLGDLTMELVYFGKAGYNGMSLVYIPEEKALIIPGFIMHSQHLAPYPHNTIVKLDVDRWISILEEFLEGENPVEMVICDINSVWTRERALTHLEYIRKLWYAVKSASQEGKNLEEVQEQLSLEKDFSFVKQMVVYKENGDEWIRPQHINHVGLFWLQKKNPASESMDNE